MALIECKECGHKVSDKAECCPNCGCPIEEIMSADASNNTNVSQVYDDAVQFDDIPPKKSKGWLWTIVVILVLAAIGVGVWPFTNGKLGEDDPTTAKVEITPEFIAAVHQYDELYPFSEGLAAVKKDGKFGYINTKGELVIPCQFDKVCDFSEGLAIVMDDDYNIKILNKDGNLKSTPHTLDLMWYGTGGWHYDKGYYSLGFNNNECAIKTNNSEDEIVIDANGTIITHPSEQNTLAFEHNITDTISHNPVLVRFSVSKENMYHNEVEYYGIKDSSNRILVQPQFFEISDFHNGVAQVVIFIGQAETKGIPYGFHLPDGEYFFGYIDKDGNSTFTDADFKKIEAYKKEQLAKKEELDRQAAEEEQARLEEERRQEESQKGPEWINGVWECHEMVDLGYFGRQRANARLCIDRENQMVSSNNDGEKYNGRYTISGNEIHFGSWYADLDNSRELIEFGKGVYYRKVSSSYTYGSSSNSSSGSSGSRSSYSGSSRTSFSSPSDVLSYTSSNSFYNGGDRLRIGFDAVYLNGTALTGAPRVTNISGSSATIIASNPYGGRALHFYVNASSGTITQNGDVYCER